MITLIADLLINEYEHSGYHIRVTKDRHTGRLESIVLDNEVYYGKIASQLELDLLSAQISQAFGDETPLYLTEYIGKGLTFVGNATN